MSTKKAHMKTEVLSAREEIRRSVFRKRRDLSITNTENERTLTILRDLTKG